MPSKTIQCVYEILVGEYRYVGSTMDFKRRKRQHKYALLYPDNKSHNGPLYKFIRDKGFCWKDVRFNILKEFEDCTNKELRECEKTHISTDFESLINVVNPSRTKRERKAKFHKEHPERALAYTKKSNEKNKEKIAAYKAEKILCDCGKIISRGSKAKHERSKFHLNYITYSNRFEFVD